MRPAELPLWVEYVKALGAPIVALIAAAIAAGIAYRQWSTARNKLKLDLFEKRMEVYKAAVDLIKEMALPHPMKWGRISELSGQLSSGRWLFGPKVETYLNDLMARGIKSLQKNKLDTTGLTSEEREALAVSFIAKGYEHLDKEINALNVLFAPFLILTH